MRGSRGHSHEVGRVKERAAVPISEGHKEQYSFMRSK